MLIVLLWCGISLFSLLIASYAIKSFSGGAPGSATPKIYNPLIYFLFFWFFSFVLRAWLITEYNIPLQSAATIEPRHIYLALLLSCVFIALIVAGFKKMQGIPILSLGAMTAPEAPFRIATAYLLSLVGAGVFIFNFLYKDSSLVLLTGNAQNELRFGHGHIFILSVVFVYMSILATTFLWRNWHGVRGPLKAVLLVCILLSICLCAYLSVALTTRRLIALWPLLACTLFFTSGYWKGWKMPLLCIAATFLFLPALDYFRYAATHHHYLLQEFFALEDIRFPERPQNLPQNKQNTTAPGAIELPIQPHEQVKEQKEEDSAQYQYRLNSVAQFSSSFEGVDHLAALIAKGSTIEIFTGFDYGLNWAYNAFAAMIPRALWEDKPLWYASQSIQRYLYSNFYAEGEPANTTLPPSFAVDFSYGFGILFACLLCHYLGRFLAVMHYYLWAANAHPMEKTLGVASFVMMVDLFRGGTAFLMTLGVFMFISLLCYGWRSTITLIMNVIVYTLKPIKSLKIA